MEFSSLFRWWGWEWVYMCNVRFCTGVQIVLKIIDCAVANCIRSELCPKNSIFTFCVVVRRFPLSRMFSVVFSACVRWLCLYWNMPVRWMPHLKYPVEHLKYLLSGEIFFWYCDTLVGFQVITRYLECVFCIWWSNLKNHHEWRKSC